MKIDSYVENLIKLGLKESEAKVYINLLKKKNFTATEIARISGVPRTKIYEVLHQLINKGLCVEILGGVKKYSSVDPENAFNGLLQKYEQDYKRDLDSKKIIVSNIKDILSPFYHSEKEKTNPLDYIQVIREKNSIAEKVYYLERTAKEEVVSFNKPPYAMNLIGKVNKEEFTSIEKGIKYKSIYEIPEARKPDFFRIIKMFADAGEEVKLINKLPLKLLIFDEKTVMFTLEDIILSKPSFTSMVIEHSAIVTTLKEVFYMYWQKGMTLEEFKKKC